MSWVRSPGDALEVGSGGKEPSTVLSRKGRLQGKLLTGGKEPSTVLSRKGR